MQCDTGQIHEAKSCLVFWDGTIDAIEQLLELVLNCLSSNVALGSGTGECATFDDDDVFRGCDALMHIAASMELGRSLDDFLLELLSVHGALLRSFDEQGGRRSAVSNDNALKNEFTTGSAEIVLDRPKLVNYKRLWVMRLRAAWTYLVSHLRLFSLLIQSSFRP